MRFRIWSVLMCKLDVRIESVGFMPAIECMVLARGSNPRAALFDGAVSTPREKKVASVGTPTFCMIVVLPQPPPPMIPTRGKLKSFGNLRKVSTVACSRDQRTKSYACASPRAADR